MFHMNSNSKSVSAMLIILAYLPSSMDPRDEKDPIGCWGTSAKSGDETDSSALTSSSKAGDLKKGVSNIPPIQQRKIIINLLRQIQFVFRSYSLNSNIKLRKFY